MKKSNKNQHDTQLTINFEKVVVRQEYNISSRTIDIRTKDQNKRLTIIREIIKTTKSF